MEFIVTYHILKASGPREPRALAVSRGGEEQRTSPQKLDRGVLEDPG